MAIKEYFSNANKEFKKACNIGDTKAMEKALAKGADINAKIFDENASALIHFAFKKNETPVVKWLIEHNADLNLTDEWGDTALHEAASRNNADNVECLLKAGADITKQNNHHETALDRARQDNYMHIIQLIEYAHHDRNSYKGFVKENDHTVSMIEKLTFSGINFRKAFNFASQEVATIADNGNSFQQFDEIRNQKRLEEAAEALVALGGNTADWKPQRPGALATQLRQK